MTTKTDGSPTCSKCGQDYAVGFRIQGQSGHMCPECLGGHAMQQGTAKVVPIDGVHYPSYDDNTALGPGGADGKMN